MHKYTDEQKKTILDLFNQGYSKSEIARKTGLPYGFVVISTPRMRSKYYLSDKAVEILKKLNENGYYFPKSTNEYDTIRRLKGETRHKAVPSKADPCQFYKREGSRCTERLFEEKENILYYFT